MARAVSEWQGRTDDTKAPPRVKDLTGKRFGQLVAKAFVGYVKNGTSRVALWHCQCDCGNTRDAAGVELSRGRIVSCGCASATRKAELAGKRFGRWLVLHETTCGGIATWRCRCDCGTEKDVQRGHLMGGRSQSCGACRPRKEKTVHSHPLYRTYCNIIQRCENKRNAAYPNYGGRGIRIHPVWRRDFWQFVADMGERPSVQHSIERIDNDRNYEPGNCIWATRSEQMRNTRRNHMVTYNGQVMPLVRACEMAGVNYGTAKWRLANGVAEKDAFS